MDNDQSQVSAASAPGASSSGADTTKLSLPEDAIVIVPVRNMVLFPGMILPLNIGRESSIAAVQYAVRAERPIGLLLQRNAADDNPQATALYTVGTVAQVLRYVTSQDGAHHVIAQGEQRF